MTNLLLGFVIGLVVGWNLLPQPAWVKRLYDAAYRRLRAWAGKLDDDGEEI